MILENCGTVHAEQIVVELLRVPSQRERDRVIGKIQARHSRTVRANVLGHANRLHSKFATRPIELLGSVLTNWGGSVIGIDVTTRTLQEEADSFVAERSRNGLKRDADIVCRVL